MRAAAVFLRTLIHVDARVFIGTELEPGRTVAYVGTVEICAEVGAAVVSPTLVYVDAGVVVEGELEAVVTQTVEAAGQVETVVLAGRQLQQTLVHVAAVEVVFQLIAREAGAGEGTRLVQTFL